MVFGSRIMLRPCIERSEVLIHTMSYTGAAGIDNSRLRSMKGRLSFPKANST